MSNAVVTDWPSGSANTGWPQEPTGMLLPGRVEGWPAGTQRAANAAERLLSQAVAWWDVEQYRDGDRFLRNRGTGGELLDLRLGSSIAPNSNDPLYLAPEDQGYVYLPGVNGNYLSVPDEAALDITGDIDIRARVTMDSWNPSSLVSLVEKWQTISTRSYILTLASGGSLRFYYSTNGTNQSQVNSTDPVGLPPGAESWVRVTLDADDSGSHIVKFYLSDDGISWSQLGSPLTGAGAITMFSSDSLLRIGGTPPGVAPLAAKVRAAQVWDGIEGSGGTKVLDIDCDAITSGSATSFTAVTNQTVTINRSTSGRKSVAVPSRHKGGKPVMLLGTDDYLVAVDSSSRLFNTLYLGDDLTVITFARVWANAARGGLVANASTIFTTSPGWTSYVESDSNHYVEVHDGTFGPYASRSQTVNGTLRSYHLVRRGSSPASGSERLVAGVDNTFSTSVTAGRIPSTVKGEVDIHVGRYPAFLNGEWYGSAIFRRALSTDEIALLTNATKARIA